jgi:HK97 family phage major capsid protein
MSENLKAADVLSYLKDNLSPMIAERVTEAVEKSRKDAGTPSAIHAAQSAAEVEMNKTRELARAKTAAGRFMRALAANQGNLGKAADYAQRVYGDSSVSKALAESTFIDGGAIVPPQFSSEIIAVLRAASVVRALGAREVPMPNGTMTMPYGSTGLTAYAAAENSNATVSQPVFGQLNLRAHKIRAIVPVSNDLLADASPQADAFVQQDMVQALRVLEDQNFVRGTGTNNAVRGLKYLAGTTLSATNAAGTSGGSTVAEVIKDLMLCLQTVENSNILIETGGWIFAPRTKYALMALKDSTGNFYFKDEMAAGKLWGFNFRATTTQPINLNDVGGLSSKESEVCFGDFDKVIIGVTGELAIQPYLGGAYHDGSSVVSGISQDQTVIVGSLRSDINCRYRGSEIVWLRGVTWGA